MKIIYISIVAEHLFQGGPARGRADEGAGEVEGNHGGARADLCRNVRILKLSSFLLDFKSPDNIKTDQFFYWISKVQPYSLD